MGKSSLKTYLKLCTEFYDLEPHPNHTEALNFYIQKAYEAKGPILEPMCGTGRFLIPMLEENLDVEGFDASEYMLDALRKKLSNINKKSPSIWQQFVQDFNNNKFYNLIFIPYGSFGLITNIEDIKKGLITLYKHLTSDGKFIVEIETEASVNQPLNVWSRSLSNKSDGSKIALNVFATYDKKTQIFQSTCRYESIINNQTKEVEEELFQQYIYKSNEIDSLLQETGFKHIKKYPAYNNLQSIRDNTQIIIYECYKN